jgi:quinol monooxygenase YgiN
MIVLSGTFTAKPECEAELLALARRLVPVSRGEQGCVRYDFLQDAIEPHRFVFFELWKSRHDLESHFGQPYFKSFAARFPELIVGDAEIVTYEAPGPVAAF